MSASARTPTAETVAGATPIAQLLIVDDEAAQVTALCETLQREGYAATGFSSATAALAALHERAFDILIADLLMPDMNGIALLAAAREIDPDLVGIVMTGHGTIDTAVAAMKTGALDYILKPFNLGVILPVLGRALAVRSLRRENAALMRRLAERTAQLEAANRELEAVNRDLSAFAHSASHDLRAPLRALDGLARILIGDFGEELPAEARQSMQSISASAQRMGCLLDDLLRFSHLGHQPLTKSTVDMTGLFNEVIRELHAAETKRTIRARVAPLPDAAADESLIRQVVVNLVSNAFKFTRHRAEALVEITGRRAEGECVYAVADNGAGFDRRRARRLFEIFQRFHGADEFEGTGVGLSIVQRIVERHGGRIWAEAEVDRGATFTFTLPDDGAREA